MAQGLFGSGFLNIPNQTKHRVFVSYHHANDQLYKEHFCRQFASVFTNVSIAPGDIDPDNSTEYIKRLIREDYIGNASVVVVLCGTETQNRKHVDWEIYAALESKSGLVGLLLPTHPDFGRPTYLFDNVPPRLADNARSGYAKMYDWTDNFADVRNRIETAFSDRVLLADKRDNSRIQFRNNR